MLILARNTTLGIIECHDDTMATDRSAQDAIGVVHLQLCAMVGLNLVDILGRPKLGDVLMVWVQHFSNECAMVQLQ